MEKVLNKESFDLRLKFYDLLFNSYLFIDDFDSGSERDFLCPPKRRRPNQARGDCPSPSDTTSLSLSLSRSSSLAQFESLEQTCQLLEASAPPSPLSLLSLDSLEKVKIQRETEISPDSLENSSDSEPNSTSSQESTYRNKTVLYKPPVLESHFNDKNLSEEKLDETYIVSRKNKHSNGYSSNYFDCDDDAKFWNSNDANHHEESSSSEFSDARSSDSDRTVHEKAKEPLPLKYNFKSCRSLDALPSFESLEISKSDNIYTSVPSVKQRSMLKQTNGQYSVENLSEDSGYSEHFCNFLRLKSKSIPNVNHQDKTSRDAPTNALKRKSEDNLFSLFGTKRKSEIVGQFGARGKFHAKSTSPAAKEMSSKQKCDKKPVNGADTRCEGKRGTGGPEITERVAPAAAAPHMRASHSSPDIRRPQLAANIDVYLDPARARNTFPKSVASKLAHLIDAEFDERACFEDANLYSVSSVPKDLNLCDVQNQEGSPSLDDNWSFGSERTVSVAAKNFDLCDFAYNKKSQKVHEATFKQSFRVCESFTTSVADLTVLDYRSEKDGSAKNVLKKLSVKEKFAKMSRNLPPTRERSAESDSTTESEKAFLFEMEKTMRELNEQSRKILAQTFDNSEFDRNLSILTNRRLNEPQNAFDDVIAELEKKQARSRAKSEKKKHDERNSTEYEFDFYGEETDPPYYRRNYDVALSNADNSSPDVSESFGAEEVFFHSTPMKGGDKVQSTPNLNIFNKEIADLYDKVAPKEELRSSMQHVPLKNEFKPVGILGSKSQGLSGSGSSKGVHFCPVVAEVSWRERSYSEESTGVASSTSSGYSWYVFIFVNLHIYIFNL